MSRSPEYIRLAARSARSLTETAFEAVREPVLVVDARLKHLPLVLANAAARRTLLLSEPDAARLSDVSLYGLLVPASASAIEPLFASLDDDHDVVDLRLTWRTATGDASAPTELKILPGASGQRLVMLTFAGADLEQTTSLALEQLPFDVLLLDADLKVTYANAAAIRTSGAGAAGLIGTSALGLVPTSALPEAVYRRALEGCHYHDDALECCAPSGARRSFEIDVRPLLRAGAVAGLVVLSTEYRDGEQRPALRVDNDRRLRTLTANAQDIILVAGSDGRLQYVSGGVRNVLGYRTEERRSNVLFDLIHPDDRDALRAKFDEVATGRITRFRREYRVRHKDGSYRWMQGNYVSALDEPQINGIVVNSRDITELKEAESQLEQREEVFRLAAEAADGVIYEWDLRRGIVSRSRGLAEILGIEPEELAPESDAWSERIHPHDFAEWKKKIGLALMGERGWTATYRIRDARGRYRSILDRALIQRDGAGDPVRAIGWCVDVSEVRRLTDLLAETQRTALMGGWEYVYATRELTWTEEMFRIYETSAAEFVVSWESMLGQCTLESRRRIREARARAETEGHLDVELEITTLKGQRIWVRLIGRIERLDGKLFRAFGSLQNIQAQKLAQIALETSTDWLKLSMSMANMHAWRWDRARDTLEFAIADGPPAHLPSIFPGMSELMAHLHPKDRAVARRAVERAFEQKSEVQAEFRLKAKDGAYRHFATIARPLFDASGAPEGLVGVTQDVTARRDAEAQLRRSEQLLRTTTASSADTLILVDTGLRIRFINKPIGESSVEQMLGAVIASVLPEPVRAAVMQKLRHVLKSGEAATYEFECRVDGADLRYFENRAVLVRDARIGTAISISMRDITERKRLEREILEVSSRERHSIGRDLHDGLGQELTGVALMLRGLATRVERRSPGTVEYINEIVGLVNQSIESARALARGLLPVRTDTGGLAFALRTLAARSRDLYGLEVNFRAEGWPEMGLSEASASHLYRIAQEALTNAARHGRPSRVEIFLEVSGSGFSLTIADDGSGIGRARKTGTGMGLKIMRYRADMIGAEFRIESNMPQGTIVRVTGEQRVVAAAMNSAHAHKGGMI